MSGACGARNAMAAFKIKPADVKRIVASKPGKSKDKK
jgi:hypothetical protein